MIRLIVKTDDASMAAHVGGYPQTTYRTFDIEHAEIEALLISSGKKPNAYVMHTLVGAEVASLSTPHTPTGE